ncbi:MAG: DNA-binding protein [Pseudomarimonas sp.]
MARTGVTQAQVDVAADALLKAGERPTIERVRSHLGTGSPNTLVRLLNDWWSRLGERLIAQEAKLALPQAPKDVVDAASALWGSALESARRLASADMASERACLEEERAATVSQMRQLQEHVAAVEAAASEDRSARHRAESREIDQDQIIGQLQSHISEYRKRLELSEAEREALAADVRAQRALHMQREQETLLEASKAADYVRAVEARSSTEIDRAREETKLAKRRFAELERQSTKASETAERRLTAAIQARQHSEAEAIRLKAQLQSVERRLDRLEEYPGLVKALREEIKKLKSPGASRQRKT